MNVLFLTLSKFESLNDRNIYVDLVKELASRGVNVYIVCPRQRREGLPTQQIQERNIRILYVKTGNITKTKSLIEKGISTVLLEFQYFKAIKKYYGSINFDMVMYSTPPITFNKIIKYYKKNNQSITYLMLKDIFPQNAVDLNTMEKKSIIWKYFRNKEIELYKISDVIGCMSQANVDYVLKQNNFIESNKMEIFPNAIKPIQHIENKKKDIEILAKYDIPTDSTVFIYGGNLGRPQGIDFLMEVIAEFNKVDDACLIIVGDGTEYKKLEHFVQRKNLKNAKIFNRLPKEEYDQLMLNADVGLIFLDHRFTIPNFPSRLLTYLENAIPVLAATDTSTDLKNILKDSQSGFWCESGDLESFIGYAKQLSSDKDLRKEMGQNGRKYLEKYYDVTYTVEKLLRHL